MGECVTMSDIKRKEPFQGARKARRSVSMSQIRLDQHINNLYQRREPNKLWQALPAGIWKGRRCFIVGGGPSLRGFDFSQLKGEIVITCNRGFESVPWSVVNLCQDARVWGWYENKVLSQEASEAFNSYRGLKTWLNVQAFPYPEDICVIDICHQSDFSFKDYVGGLPPYGNTGLNALCLAACLGADPIYLLGFDCKGEDGKTANFHSGYPDRQEEHVYTSFVTEFNEVAHLLKGKNKVVNLNSNSGIRCFDFAEFKDVPKINRPLYVSYYSKGTGYEIEIERLRDSLRNFGVEYEFIGIEDLGSWRQNIHARIQVLRDALDRFQRDIVYIDADGAMIHYPDLFDNFDADFGAVWLDREKYFPNNWTQSFYGEDPAGKWEVLGGTMYFKNNKRTRAMLDAWEVLDAPMKTRLSQVHLVSAMAMVPNLKIRKLPDNYCQIFDIMAAAGEPVIEHYQASRRCIDRVKISKKGFSLDKKLPEDKVKNEAGREIRAGV